MFYRVSEDGITKLMCLMSKHGEDFFDAESFYREAVKNMTDDLGDADVPYEYLFGQWKGR